MVWGEDYNNALCNSKIALCFLSKVNNDTYTRRCFEIPATETLLMSEKTSDLTSLFQENNEAVFFEKINDFGEKLDKLLNNKNEIKRIARNGNMRIWKDGHDINSRVKYIIKIINEFERKR